MDVASRIRCSEPHKGIFLEADQAYLGRFGTVGIGVFLALEHPAKVGVYLLEMFSIIYVS